jgi:uncharacterized protein with HEPN domain
MSLSGVEYLRHIVDEAEFVSTSVRGRTRDDFLADEILKRAVVRGLEVIGEAAKQVPESIRGRGPLIEWRAMAGIRDRLIHAYFGVDYEIVWDVAVTKIPTLISEVRTLLDDLLRESDPD